MAIHLVDDRWDAQFDEALRDDNSALRIICPFIKVGAIERLLDHKPNNIRVITRFNLADFAGGVSDIAALRKLLDAGAKIRGVQNLHAKLYIFGKGRAILTSANLTAAALSRNQEFGMIAENEPNIVNECRDYFSNLWNQAGKNLQRGQLDGWAERVTSHNLLDGAAREFGNLQDYGTKVGLSELPSSKVPQAVAHASQSFVKFGGYSNDRRPLTVQTIDMVKSGGSHWAVCYPINRRPRRVRDNAVIFVALLTRDSGGTADIHIFGRAIGMEYKEVRDDATTSEIRDRSWKDRYPHYIRVHQAEFVDGTLENGISLNELMKELKANSFATTQRNAASGEGNTDPRKAYLRQPDVELSQEGFSWLAERLQEAFETYGKIPQEDINALDWPDVASN